MNSLEVSLASDHHFNGNVSTRTTALCKLILWNLDGNLNVQLIFLCPNHFHGESAKHALALFQVVLEECIHAVLSSRSVIVVVIEGDFTKHMRYKRTHSRANEGSF